MCIKLSQLIYFSDINVYLCSLKRTNQMIQIHDFQSMIERLRFLDKTPRVAVVCPDDEHTRVVMQRFEADGLARFLCFDGEPGDAARQAVASVRRGEADVLMKGLVNTDVLLRAILDKQQGLLLPGSVMSHVAVCEIPGYHKLLICSDVAVIPNPTLKQYDAIVRYATKLCRQIHPNTPRIALLHCNEHVSEKFPVTLSYEQLKAWAAEGQYGQVAIEGPMDVKSACDAESARIKGMVGAVSGEADIAVFPDIEAGNTFYKTITHFCHARTACMLTGTTAPVVLPSRSDSSECKYYSLALACLALGGAE